MIDRGLRTTKDRVVGPAARVVAGRIGPGWLTALSLAGGLGGGVAAGFGLRWQAVAVWLLGRVFDGLDGAVARDGDRQSDLGGYLDMMADTVGYAAVPIGIATAQASVGTWTWCAVLLATFYVNTMSWTYLAAIAEKRGGGAARPGERTTIHMPAGLVEGAETIVLFVLMLVVPRPGDLVVHGDGGAGRHHRDRSGVSGPCGTFDDRRRRRSLEPRTPPGAARARRRGVGGADRVRGSCTSDGRDRHVDTAQGLVDAARGNWWAIVAYIAVSLVRPLVLFPATIVTVAAGILFGPFVGVAVAAVAANASAMIGYSIGRNLRRPDQLGGHVTTRGMGVTPASEQLRSSAADPAAVLAVRPRELRVRSAARASNPVRRCDRDRHAARHRRVRARRLRRSPSLDDGLDGVDGRR